MRLALSLLIALIPLTALAGPIELGDEIPEHVASIMKHAKLIGKWTFCNNGAAQCARAHTGNKVLFQLEKARGRITAIRVLNEDGTIAALYEAPPVR